MRICFAGAEYEKHADTLHNAGIKNCALNFYNFRKRSGLSAESLDSLVESITRFENVFVSFGAGSLNEAIAARESGFEEWASVYLGFCKILSGYVELFEAPIAEGASAEEMNRWLDTFVEENIQVGQHVPWDDAPTTLDEDAESISTPTVIVSGTEKSSIKCSNRIKELGSRGYDVHIRGITSDYIFYNYPARSCDSMKWLSGELHGQIFIFENRRLKTVNNKPASKNTIVEAARAAKVDPDNILKPASKE